MLKLSLSQWQLFSGWIHLTFTAFSQSVSYSFCHSVVPSATCNLSLLFCHRISAWNICGETKSKFCPLEALLFPPFRHPVSVFIVWLLPCILLHVISCKFWKFSALSLKTDGFFIYASKVVQRVNGRVRKRNVLCGRLSSIIACDTTLFDANVSFPLFFYRDDHFYWQFSKGRVVNFFMRRKLVVAIFAVVISVLEVLPGNSLSFHW